MRKCYLFLILIILAGHVNAQHELSIAPSYGTQLIPEDNDSLFHDDINGLDISYSQSTQKMTGDWIKFFNAKHIEYAFIYLNFDRLKGFHDPNSLNFVAKKVDGLGKHYGLISSIKMQLYQQKNNFRINFIPGFGLCYISKTYYSDSQNFFIGTHINFTIRFQLQLEQQLSKRWALTAAGRFLHSSNGGFQMPNAGINTIGTSIGILWKLNHHYE